MMSKICGHRGAVNYKPENTMSGFEWCVNNNIEWAECDVQLTDENILLIIHDDLDLKLGELRIKKGGGHGGHNGLRDIINKTGQDNFMRLRIGISHPGNKNDVTNWVLTKFSPDEKKLISSSYSKFEKIIELICNNKIEEAQKILHTR